MIRNAIASLPVDGIERASDWYERLIGRPADSVPMKEVAEWQFERGGWLQIYDAPDRAGGGSLTLSVIDLDEEVSRLRELGMEINVTTDSDPVRVAMLEDPDGNRIALAETVDPTMAQ